MTKIIGHRGAMGLALENSLAGIKAALSYTLDAIEIDVKRTKDGQLVLLHDAHTGRVAKRKVKVQDVTLEELRALALNNGEHIPTLEQVFMLVGDKMPLMLDIKSSNAADELLHLLELFPQVRVFVSGRKYNDLKRLHAARPDMLILLQHHHDPVDIIHHAHSMDADGICLNMWLMNPWTYRLAKQHNLEVYVYTINHRWILRFFQRLYPNAAIITNHPERLTGHLSAKTTSSTLTTPSR